MRRSNDFIDVTVSDEQKGRGSSDRDFDRPSTVALRDQIGPCAVDAIDRASRSIAGAHAHAKEKLRNMPIKPEIDQRNRP